MKKLAKKKKKPGKVRKKIEHEGVTINEKEAKLLVEEGWIRLKAMFELIGRPKEHVEKQIEEYVKKFAKENIKIISLDREQAQEAGEDEHGKYWSVVAECDLVIENMSKLWVLAINYTPSYIEVLGPKKITISDVELTHFTNELLGKLHYLNSLALLTNRELDKNRKSLKLLAMNAAVLALFSGPKSLEDISKLVGIKEEEMVKIMNELKRKGIVDIKDSKYFVVFKK